MTPFVVFHYVLPICAAALGPLAYVFVRFGLMRWYSGSDRQLTLPFDKRRVVPGE